MIAVIMRTYREEPVFIRQSILNQTYRDLGLPGALNKALGAAKGDHIAGMDAYRIMCRVANKRCMP